MSGYLDWHVGMKVVVVVGVAGRQVIDGEARLDPKQIYTIRELVPYGDTFHIRLVEIVNPIRLYRWPDGDRFSEMAYLKESFRPVQKRTTSIECFTALLNPSPADKADIELADFIIEHALPMEQIG